MDHRSYLNLHYQQGKDCRRKNVDMWTDNGGKRVPDARGIGENMTGQFDRRGSALHEHTGTRQNKQAKAAGIESRNSEWPRLRGSTPDGAEWLQRHAISLGEGAKHRRILISDHSQTKKPPCCKSYRRVTDSDPFEPAGNGVQVECLHAFYKKGFVDTARWLQSKLRASRVRTIEYWSSSPRFLAISKVSVSRHGGRAQARRVKLHTRGTGQAQSE